MQHTPQESAEGRIEGATVFFPFSLLANEELVWVYLRRVKGSYTCLVFVTFIVGFKFLSA